MIMIPKLAFFPQKYLRQDIELDFSEENLEKQKRDPGACESVLGKAIMNLLNDYRALYNTTSKLSVPTTYNPVYEIDKDTMAWAWKLVDSKFNPKNRVIHQEDSRSRRFYGRDIVVQGSWSFDTRDPTGPGMAVLSMPAFLEAYFDRSRALYQKYYGTTTGKDDTTVVEAADLITFDPFTRLLWAGSADVGIGCSLKYTQEKSFFYLVVNINKKVGNAGQDQKPNELPPPLTLAELKANVLCQECARKDMSTDT